MLGATGMLGDTGSTLTALGKTYSDAAQQVVSNGGQVLAYNTSGLALTGSLSTASLLPAKDASTLTFDDLRDVALSGKVISAFIPGNSPIVNFQVVNKATGKGISGLRTFSLHVAQLKPELAGSNSYWLNYIASGLPLTAIPAASSAPSNPSTDSVTSFNTDGSVKGQGYTVIDHGDGTYTATFGANIKANTNVAYDASLTHRIVVGVRSVVVPGVVGKTTGAYAGAVNPLTGAVIAQFTNTNGTALVYDFVPATGAMLADGSGSQTFARDIVTIGACNQCHYRLEFGSNNTSGHMGSRPDTKVCVVCHTQQLGVSGSGNFTQFIHQIHRGDDLPVAITSTTQALAGAIPASDVTYPQDIRNCTFCHKGADVTSWMAKPSRNACGSCHNDVDFTVGTNHQAGAYADDNTCNSCHGTAAVSLYHLPIAPPDPNSALAVYAAAPYNANFGVYSAAYQANGRVAFGNSNTNASYVAAASLSRLPAGAKAVSYVINSVTVDANNNPNMKFKFQMATADTNGLLGTATDVVFNTSNGSNEMITGFVGSPSIYFTFAVPQDGITAPVDYNASVSNYLKRVWDGTVVAKQGSSKLATLTGPDANGYYTVIFTGVKIPTSAVMLTGGIGYTYGIGSVMTQNPAKTPGLYFPFMTTTQPLTQIDLPNYPYTLVSGTGIGLGGLSVPADNKWKVATNFTGRRLITDTAKCNACHGRLGVNPTFHAGQRNDAQTCTFCHHANLTNSGWGGNIKVSVHAIHAASKRLQKYSWEASAGDQFWNVTYPGVLKDCEQCHIAGMYDFSGNFNNPTASPAVSAYTQSVFDSMLYTTDASGTINAAGFPIITGAETVTSSSAVISPYVTAGTNYGAAFSFAANNTTTGTTTAAAATTLVSSPITSACFSCHDSKAAKAHMINQGGSIYEARSTALLKQELCVTCHGGISSTNAFNQTAPNIKAVHRWW